MINQDCVQWSLLSNKSAWECSLRAKLQVMAAAHISNLGSTKYLQRRGMLCLKWIYAAQEKLDS